MKALRGCVLRQPAGLDGHVVEFLAAMSAPVGKPPPCPKRKRRRGHDSHGGERVFGKASSLRYVGGTLTSSIAPGYEVPPAGHDVLILPDRVDGENGIYSDAVLVLKKQLVEVGIDADYLHDADHQLWEGRKGVGIVVSVLISFGSSAAVAAIQSWLTARFVRDRVHLKTGRHRQPDGSVTEWFEAEGSGSEGGELLDRFLEENE